MADQRIYFFGGDATDLKGSHPASYVNQFLDKWNLIGCSTGPLFPSIRFLSGSCPFVQSRGDLRNLTNLNVSDA